MHEPLIAQEVLAESGQIGTGVSRMGWASRRASGVVDENVHRRRIGNSSGHTGHRGRIGEIGHSHTVPLPLEGTQSQPKAFLIPGHQGTSGTQRSQLPGRGEADAL